MNEWSIPVIKENGAGIEMAVLCNQTGYLPQGRKRAVLTAGELFRVMRDDGGQVSQVMEGDARDAGVDAASGDRVSVADFSAVAQEGVYYVENELGERSHRFRIGGDVYRTLQRDLTKALYYQRCGCELEERYAGVYTHPCCHMQDAALWTDRSVVKEVKGGWHDAGDYGRYISPAAVAVGHLLYAYQLFPDSFGDSLDIPESGNGVPDVLNECRYELEWMLKVQDDEGGVYHKLTSERHADFIMPEEDRAQFYLFPVSSMATADYAASMALASRVYRAYDGAFADRLYMAAEKAYGWLERHPGYVGFHNPAGCNTGEYDDDCDLDERLWAAAELLVTTGEQKYQEQVAALLQEDLTLTDFGWTDVSGFAALAILTDASHKASDASVTALRRAVIAEADRLTAVAEQSGYGVAMEPADYIWGSNMVVLNRGMLLALAALLMEQDEAGAGEQDAADERTAADRQRTYVQTVQAQLDYLLGVNAVDYSYVTGHGERACMHPHNRPTECDGIEQPMPGWVSGGPFKTPCDEVGRARIPEGTPPMKCYLDHAACYSLNEITIYWNTPAVFITAYLNQKRES